MRGSAWELKFDAERGLLGGFGGFLGAFGGSWQLWEVQLVVLHTLRAVPPTQLSPVRVSFVRLFYLEVRLFAPFGALRLSARRAFGAP